MEGLLPRQQHSHVPIPRHNPKQGLLENGFTQLHRRSRRPSEGPGISFVPEQPTSQKEQGVKCPAKSYGEPSSWCPGTIAWSSPLRNSCWVLRVCRTIYVLSLWAYFFKIKYGSKQDNKCIINLGEQKGWQRAKPLETHNGSQQVMVHRDITRVLYSKMFLKRWIQDSMASVCHQGTPPQNTRCLFTFTHRDCPLINFFYICKYTFYH